MFVNAPTGLLFVGDPGVPERGTESDLNNFAPRVGFAWDAGEPHEHSRCVWHLLRLVADERDHQCVSGSGAVRNAVTTDGRPRDRSMTPSSARIRSRCRFHHRKTSHSRTAWPRRHGRNNYRTGYLQSWHFTVEREVVPNWLVRVAYAGSKGTKLLQGEELNPPAYIPGSIDGGKHQPAAAVWSRRSTSIRLVEQHRQFELQFDAA